MTLEGCGNDVQKSGRGYKEVYLHWPEEISKQLQEILSPVPFHLPEISRKIAWD
jgi:hypothetical protein